MRKPASIIPSGQVKKGRPALTPEARENQLINLALNVAEEQLLNGTASSQVITHFLKLGTAKAQLEAEKIRHENNLLEAKAEAIKKADNSTELYENVLKAMRSYSGYGDPDEY